MSTLRYAVRLAHDSGLPEDEMTNRWHFNTSTTPSNAVDRGGIFTALLDFYHGVDSYFSPVLTGALVCDVYDMADPEPRVPVETFTGTLVLSGSDPLPQEVSMVLSFQAVAQSGVNQARRRNRVYLGPLATNALGDPGSPETLERPDATFRSDILLEAGQLLAASDLAANWSWVVRSETAGTFALVDNGWVDNAWDTQRRRGKSASLRQTFT